MSAHGDDVAGYLRVVFELLPEPGDVDVYSPGPDERLVLPNARQQALARENVPTMVDEMPQQMHFFGGKAHWGATTQHLTAIKIDCDVAEPVLQNGGQRSLPKTPEQGAHACEQFVGNRTAW